MLFVCTFNSFFAFVSYFVVSTNKFYISRQWTYIVNVLKNSYQVLQVGGFLQVLCFPPPIKQNATI